MPDLIRLNVHSSSRKAAVSRRRTINRRNKKKIEASSVRRLLLLIVELVAVIMLAFVLVQAFGTTIIVPEESMEPTLFLGDHVLVDRISLKFKDPKANDVVVFVPEGNLSAQQSIKRVIGVPGDTIIIKGGIVYVNDNPFQEVADVGETVSAGLASGGITLKEDEYFLLGDNRSSSEDSRFATIGNIKKKELLGRVWFNIEKSNFGIVH